MNIKKNFCRFILLALFAPLLIINAVNADYSFSVPSAETVLEIDNNGEMTISIEYQFRNRGQKLDFIDIGLPNNYYSLGDIQVWLDDEVNSEIKVVKADYDQTGLRYGITLEMNGAAIPSGGSGKILKTAAVDRDQAAGEICGYLCGRGDAVDNVILSEDKTVLCFREG